MVRPSQGALVARRVGAVRLGLHAHRGYLERRGHPRDLADLRRFALIGFETDNATVRAMERRGLSMRRDDFAFRTDSDLGQWAAIRAGAGVGACQVPLALREPDLVRLLPEAFAHDLEIWIVMHEDLRSTKRVRIAFDHLAEALSAYAAIGAA
jgi:DNA-binding transcriptional LysR family regulator